MNYVELLDHIRPDSLSYDEWLSVGMALKHEGASNADWESWSRQDTKRFRDGECARKWAGFHGSGFTGGTIVEYAKRNGWRPARYEGGNETFGWDDPITDPDEKLRIIDQDWIEDAEITGPEDWNPVNEITTYLKTLFDAGDYVGYVVDSWTSDDGKRLPQKGSYARTCGEIIDALSKCNGDVGQAIGDYDPTVGAWIRFNPLDGKGVNDSSVTAFRYALVECDEIPIERQAAIYRDLDLPVAIMVHSGSRSLHAIVRIDAGSIEEYRDRVNFLFQVLEKNGIEKKARGNKNPSRLSRMPGIMRNGNRQYIVSQNQGKASWDDWKAFIDEANDNLPDFECLADVWDNMPDKATPLIDGVLREGHKLLLAGPSKAGKSYLLLQLAIAIAEGRDWLGWPCQRGKVLYVNLELDRVSGMHRLKELYDAKGWKPEHVSSIDVWNLRGKAVPLDALAPKLIRRAIKKRYTAIIIDPIYKVLTGSENEADDMAKFCNQFDKICAELGAATIYCHHHSKGAQGQRNSRDRSSGSGVFARDPDAILDVIELNIGEHLRKQIENREVCKTIAESLDVAVPDWRDEVGQDDALVANKMLSEARRLLGPGSGIEEDVSIAKERAEQMSGWRLEATLREFPPFAPRCFWFRHPVHFVDDTGMLDDAMADGDEFTAKGKEKQAKVHKEKQKEKGNSIKSAWDLIAADEGKTPLLKDVAEITGLTIRQITTSMFNQKTEFPNAKKDIQDSYNRELEEAFDKEKDLEGKCSVADLAKSLCVSERQIRTRTDTHPLLRRENGFVKNTKDAQS